MPADRAAVNYRCTPEHHAALESLMAAAGADSLADLLERGAKLLARKHKVELPERAKPFGTNRYGEPKIGKGKR